PAEEGAVGVRLDGYVRHGGDRLAGHLPVGGEVVRTAEQVVVDPGCAGLFDVDRLGCPVGSRLHRALRRTAPERCVPRPSSSSGYATDSPRLECPQWTVFRVRVAVVEASVGECAGICPSLWGWRCSPAASPPSLDTPPGRDTTRRRSTPR